MPPAVRLLVGALVATALAVAVGVLVFGGSETSETPDAADTSSPAPTSVELSALPADGLAVARTAFCDAVPPETVAAALGTPAQDLTVYGNGQRAQLTQETRDVAHEYGCTWTAGKARARAWVFAPPVAPGQARTLVRTAADEAGCRRDEDAPAYGNPSVALACRVQRSAEVSYRGLFGDAWLTCTLLDRSADRSADDASVEARAGRWCAGVALAASSGSPGADAG